MSLTTLLCILLIVNTGIAIYFAEAVWSRREPWDWPPSWARVVAMWLSSKALWLGVLGLLWATNQVRFTPTADAWGKTTYIVVLAIFTVYHATALLYYVTGRAALTPLEPIDAFGWDGTTERRRFVRRAADRPEETPIQQLIRERDELP